MNKIFKLELFSRQPSGALLGLAFDGSRLEGMVLRRTNGGVEIKNTFAGSLSLDPLTNAPELVGREIRNLLDSQGIRVRRCTVCLPLSWALTLTIPLPQLPESDLDSFLQIEAERGFPYGPDALILSQSRYRTAAGDAFATLVAVPREHVSRLEAVLRAAQLRPESFSLGLAAMQSAEAESSQGVLALLPTEHGISLQVSGGGGLAVLRTVEGIFEVEGGQTHLQADQVAREVRITLGQLPAAIRETVRELQVFGRSDAAEELAEDLPARLATLGIKVELVRDYRPGVLGLELPANTPPSSALSLAVRHLAGQPANLEFLPPKVHAWQQFASRYSSRKLVVAGAVAGAVILVIGLAFLVQQWQLVRWRSKWTAMARQVTELEAVQQQIKKYRSWYDPSFGSLSILRQLTEAFPEDGSVTAKTVEIREAMTVTCSGTARDHQALLRTLDRLRAVKEVSSVQVEQMRGRAPIQFTFNFRWKGGGKP